MAVNGFLVNDEVQKYNYESLENYNTPDFSSSSTYQVGDYVMYQGKLYKCTTEIATSGGWNPSKWSLAILSDDVANLKNSVESGEYGLSEPVKQAILQIARKIAYIDDQGQTYYDDLYDALYPLNVVSISATYTQSGTVYDTDSLDSLKADLVVTANYSDSSTQTVPAADYTLSGTLTAGTSTVTVSYGGKTTTFNVTVKGRTVLSATPIAWNSASGSLVTISGSDVTVKGNGRGYPNAVLKNLLYQLSQTTGKRVHIIVDVVVSGLTSGTYQCLCGLFPNQNPSTMGNRVVANGGILSPSMICSSNGTYHFDSVFYPQEDTTWESYSGYVGVVVFGNSPNSGASAKVSNMEAFLEDV